jgi:hypothetical protein
MMKQDQTMRRYLQALEPSAQTVSEWHLSHDELLRLTQTTEDDASVAPLREHLAHCVTCVADFKDVNAFYAPPSSQEIIPNERELNRAWAAFTPHLPKARREVTATAAPESSWWRNIFTPRLGWALAGLLLAAAAVGFWWALRLRNEKQIMASSFAEERNRYIKALDDAKRPPEKPNDTARPTPLQEIKVRIPPRGNNFSFVIRPENLPQSANYRAEIFNPDGTVFWPRSKARRGPEGDFRFNFPRNRVTSGDYRARFYTDESGEQVAAECLVKFSG